MRPTVLLTLWMPLDTADVMPCQMFPRNELTRFHTLVHTPLMAFRTVEMVLRTFWMHVDTTPLIAFQMLAHTLWIALRTLPIVVLMPLMIGVRNATMPSHVVVKNDLIASHAPCQSPLRKLRNTTMTVRIAFTTVEMQELISPKIVDTTL